MPFAPRGSESRPQHEAAGDERIGSEHQHQGNDGEMARGQHPDAEQHGARAPQEERPPVADDHRNPHGDRFGEASHAEGTCTRRARHPMTSIEPSEPWRQRPGPSPGAALKPRPEEFFLQPMGKRRHLYQGLRSGAGNRWPEIDESSQFPRQEHIPGTLLQPGGGVA